MTTIEDIRHRAVSLTEAATLLAEASDEEIEALFMEAERERAELVYENKRSQLIVDILTLIEQRIVK